jgi:hypothetical protein
MGLIPVSGQRDFPVDGNQCPRDPGRTSLHGLPTMECTMLHDEMVLIIPVIAFTFLAMGWIVSQFRGYLKQRDQILESWEKPQEYPDHQIHRKAA